MIVHSGQQGVISEEVCTVDAGFHQIHAVEPMGYSLSLQKHANISSYEPLWLLCRNPHYSPRVYLYDDLKAKNVTTANSPTREPEVINGFYATEQIKQRNTLAARKIHTHSRNTFSRAISNWKLVCLTLHSPDTLKAGQHSLQATTQTLEMYEMEQQLSMSNTQQGGCSIKLPNFQQLNAFTPNKLQNFESNRKPSWRCTKALVQEGGPSTNNLGQPQRRFTVYPGHKTALQRAEPISGGNTLNESL